MNLKGVGRKLIGNIIISNLTTITVQNLTIQFRNLIEKIMIIISQTQNQKTTRKKCTRGNYQKYNKKMKNQANDT